MKIWTNEECLDVSRENIVDLVGAMYFKAANIRAKADPELFEAVGDALALLWKDKLDYKSAVRCIDCKFWHTDGARAEKLLRI